MDLASKTNLTRADRAANTSSTPDDLTARAVCSLVERSAILRFLAQRETQLRRDRRNVFYALRQFREKFANSDENAQIIDVIPLNPDSPVGPNPTSEPETPIQEP